MDIKFLFNRIRQDDKIYTILKELNMHHIKDCGNYYTCGFPDGDNPKSTVVYKNSLNVEAYTRDIQDKSGYKNILSLVMYVKSLYIVNAIKWICDVCGYDIYNQDYQKPKLLEILDEIQSARKRKKDTEEENTLKILDIKILDTYYKTFNKMFYEDGINYKTQKLFGLGYDFQTHRITIPILDELGQLVGVKGRFAGDINLTDSKYLYLFSCSKNQLLFGLDKTYEYIKQSGIVYVAESEKAVMQGWSNNIKNVVSIGGHQLSSTQVKKLTHLGVEVCLCYDDKADFVNNIKDDDFYQKEKAKFINGIKVSCIIDPKNEVLGDKESPFDNLDLWDELLKMKRIIV